MTGSTMTRVPGCLNVRMKSCTMAICSAEPKKPVAMPSNWTPFCCQSSIYGRMRSV